jgi:hypothetical protein
LSIGGADPPQLKMGPTGGGSGKKKAPRKSSYEVFMAKQRAFSEHFVCITALLSASFAINVNMYFNNLFTPVMPPLVATRLK